MQRISLEWAVRTRLARRTGVFVAFAALTMPFSALAQTGFNGAPASAVKMANPVAGQTAAIKQGATLYATNCANCHGAVGQGNGNIPGVATDKVRQAKEGELFWFITHGSVNNGMPAWDKLSEAERWQLVSLLKSGDVAKASATADVPAPIANDNWPPPKPPFTDFRYEAPGKTRKITVADLPQPYATPSAGNAPKVVPRPANVWPKTLPGFKVDIYAQDLKRPRLMRTAPNGDVFVSETHADQITVFHGMTADGKPASQQVFATDLNKPFGIAFYPPGPNPQYIYVGNTDEVVRFRYSNGDLKVQGKPEHIASLPHGDGHSTRDVAFSPDGKRLYASVGSGSNVDDPDTTPAEHNRADILVMNPDGSDMKVYASGIRNPVGLAVDQKSGEVWTSVNERDGLGDNLVPDYITHVQEGGFYGWPWWYMGNHQDPRHAGKHPELGPKAIVPDVLLNPHNASLQLTIYDGKQFPAQYRGDIFAAEHGSWNRSARAGYEVIRVPRHGTTRASGVYEDFLTGFVLPTGQAWGRPVGVTVAPDGSLLVSDDGSNTIWRVSHGGAGAAAGQ
ncbi:PQQ-dependent sugar dehydrogenase [Pinirhizobacter sp.]|jgi:glucose/arabinose dehydrogenase/cytochrome c5|uniref:PQQ-dependent sugar dehydrogenase n=1 Tax=Pinirhizobacter sp. TaxID=2950432 RepID=UPI002F3EABC3